MSEKKAVGQPRSCAQRMNSRLHVAVMWRTNSGFLPSSIDRVPRHEGYVGRQAAGCDLFKLFLRGTCCVYKSCLLCAKVEV